MNSSVLLPLAAERRVLQRWILGWFRAQSKCAQCFVEATGSVNGCSITSQAGCCNELLCGCRQMRSLRDADAALLRSCAFVNGSSSLAVGCHAGSMQILDVVSGEVLSASESPHNCPVNQVRVSITCHSCCVVQAILLASACKFEICLILYNKQGLCLPRQPNWSGSTFRSVLLASRYGRTQAARWCCRQRGQMCACGTTLSWQPSLPMQACATQSSIPRASTLRQWPQQGARPAYGTSTVGTRSPGSLKTMLRTMVCLSLCITISASLPARAKGQAPCN